MDLQLTGKTVFVTGASGGIGRALADEIAGEGANVVLQGRSRTAELERWVAERPWRERALCVRADTRVLAEVEAAMDAAVARFGRVDGCVANAGVWPPGDAPLHEVSEERVRLALETNLLGSMWTAKAFLRALAAAGPRADGHGASLVLVGSTAGRFGERGHAEYAASKAGLHGLVRTLKNEIVALDPFGRVNLVEPGWTVTSMARPTLEVPGAIAAATRTMALRQLARAVDVARAVLWLLSPAMARHVSGEIITVAGGMEGRVLWASEDVDEDAVRRRARSTD